MGRLRAMLAGAAALLLFGIGLWFVTMPYPIDLWWEACLHVRYSDTWPISMWDFTAARCLVKHELGWREIITGVSVTGPDEIRFTSLSRWKHALAAGGHRFVVRKVNGKWAVVDWWLWMS